MFRDRAATAGVNEYTMTIQGSTNDPVPENNSARALVGVEGSKPVLIVSAAGENSGLVKLLRGGDVEVIGKSPEKCDWSLESLSQFSSVILENVPAGEIGMSGMETLASWVEETGSGLAMTGGQKSYGPGGYFKSPLERVMPVSMEMRREHRKLSVAVVVALDRSGSMSMPAGGGRNKMDLADLGTVSGLDLLSPMDEIGVFAVDTTAHEIVPLDTVEHNIGYRWKILAIGSEGGGIYIYEALVASARMISIGESADETHHFIFRRGGRRAVGSLSGHRGKTSRSRRDGERRRPRHGSRRGREYVERPRAPRRRRMLFQRQPGRNPAHFRAGHVHHCAQHVR